MNDAAALIGIGTIMAAILGPLAAVCAADRMQSRENKRVEAARVFRRVITSCTSFITAAGNAHSIILRSRKSTDATIDHESLREEIKRERIKVQTLKTTIVADMFSFALLFEEKGNACIDAVNELTTAGLMIDTDDFLTTNEYRHELNVRLSRITQCIAEIHKSLRRPDSFGEDD